LSSQLAAAEAAAAAARSKALQALAQARAVAPQHRLAAHDGLLLSARAASVVDSAAELLSDNELQDAARLARDSMALFPLQVIVFSLASPPATAHLSGAGSCVPAGAVRVTSWPVTRR
jgi:hypothetical protein